MPAHDQFTAAMVTLTLSNFTAPGDGFLVAGNYSGAVVVTLGPAAVIP